VLSLLNKISTALGWLGFVSVIALTLLIGHDVFMRYVLLSPTRWTLEVAMGIQMLFGFLCAGYVLREGGHIRMQLFTEHISLKKRLWLFMVTSGLGFLLCVVLAYYSWLMTVSSYRIGELTSLVEYPIWWLKAIILVGFSLLGLQFVAETYKYYRQLKSLADKNC
jgi:TRAP-type C4-dicarboxylate transport system permease small subunit